jgi:hypothetical protein
VLFLPAKQLKNQTIAETVTVIYRIHRMQQSVTHL